MENVLSILFCLSLLYLALTARVKDCVNVLQVQGIILAIINTIPLFRHFTWVELILPVALLTVKGILIPFYIRKIISDLDIKDPIEPTIQQFTFLMLVIILMSAAFVASSMLSKVTDINIIPFASGFSAIITGILIIIFRKKLLVHVMGFLALENGIFLFGSSIAFKLPVIIELGMLLDIFVVVFLMGIALNKINTTLSGFEAAQLRRLKD
jgi:hydrogenase-4 component E